MRAFLRQRRVIEDQDGIGATHEAVRLGEEFGFQWGLAQGPTATK